MDGSETGNIHHGEAQRGDAHREDALRGGAHPGYARRWWYLLFLIQFIAVLWPPFYNRADPPLWGIPFFYWYQLLWVLIGAVCTATVYFATPDREH